MDGKTQTGLEALVMATSNGLEDAVLNAPLPDIALPADTSSVLAAESVELHTVPGGHLPKSHSHGHAHPHTQLEGSTAPLEKPNESHQLRAHSVPRLGTSMMPRPAFTVSIDLPSGAVTTVPTTSSTLGAPEATVGLTDEPGRPAKRRRGGRRATDPNMSAEDRRRQRVLKNRESAMRSLAKKAKFSADLQAEQAALQNELQTKQIELRKLAELALDLREKLEEFGENDLVPSFTSCINRCLAVTDDFPGGLTITPSHPIPHTALPLAPALVDHQTQLTE